jgi:arylsulfatase A-like enzyme
LAGRYCCGDDDQRDGQRPNVVFFFTDDQAYDTLGCYGNPDVKTPNIDALARQGVVFDRHYDTTAICMASRANVMTGLLEYKSGCNFMHGPLARSMWRKSYPVLLRQAGYRTAFGGKFGFAVVEDPRQGGSEGKYENLPLADFDFWVGGTGQTSYVTAQNKYLEKYAAEYPHSTRAYGAAGCDFIRESVAAGQPFCLTLFFKAPHRPTTPDPIFDDVYRNTVFRKLPNYGRPAGAHLAPQSRMGRQYPRFEQWGYDKEDTYQQALRTYNQQIYGVDYAVGMVMGELRKQGLDDNTVVLFSSDNGFFNGSHGLGSKVLPYEEGARVPMIIRDPRQPSSAGQRCGAVTGNVDIAATIVDLAGLHVPKRMDGKSLMGLVDGSQTHVREALPIIQAWGTAGTLALSVVTHEYKYIYWMYGEGVAPTEELFHLQDDPYEMENIADRAEHREALMTMRGHYDAEVARWKEHAVAYNDYQSFGVLYDRTIPWEDKSHLLPKQFAKSVVESSNRPTPRPAKKREKRGR